MTIEGIDLSSNNANWRSIDTRGVQLCVVKLTQGLNYHWSADPDVIAWGRTWATWVMGYHWIDPTVSASGQARFFADAYEQLGLDGWWLDIEDPRRPAIPWVTLVPSVFDLVAARLSAARGGCYKGRYFAPELNGYCAAHNWWDPDYRGGHADLSGGVLLDQYTSTGGPGGSPLDRSRVLDEPRFLAMVGARPGPQSSEDDMPIIVTSGKTSYISFGAGLKPIPGGGDTYKALKAAGIREVHVSDVDIAAWK